MRADGADDVDAVGTDDVGDGVAVAEAEDAAGGVGELVQVLGRQETVFGALL